MKIGTGGKWPFHLTVDVPQIWTKLRPGVHAFLRAAAELFQMTVHTNGAVTV